MSHTAIAEFMIRDRTARLSLIESNTGVLSLNFSWSAAPPASMDFADQLLFADGLAEALEALVPHAFDRSDDDDSEDLAGKFHDGGMLCKREVINTFDAASLIKAAHRSGGTPLLKQTTRSRGAKR